MRLDSVRRLSVKKVYMKTDARFAFKIQDDKKQDLMEIAFNQEFGLMLIDSASKEKLYQDVNIFNSLK